jgi:PST family polysaccharide transporter
MLWCIHGTSIALKDLLLAIGRPFLSCVTAALPAYLIRLYLGESLTPILRLTLCGGAMIIFYLVLLLFVMDQKTFYLNLLKGLRKSVPTGNEETMRSNV